MSLVEAKGITKTFQRKTSWLGHYRLVSAVDGIDLEIQEGETLGLVGESGSGKSTLGRLLLQLEKPDSGEIYFRGEDLAKKSEEEVRSLRRQMQMVFQDPYGSLNPRMSVYQILLEPLQIFDRKSSSEEKRKRILETLERVGLRENALARYPHEFSGGQRQRIGIARAIILRPSFIVCDEPVSALDVSIQAQILNLLKELQSTMGFTYLFISHDLRVIHHMCHRVAVMYQGKILERGSCEKVFEKPETDYTQTLLNSVPRLEF